MADDHKEFVARFYELLKATKHPAITESDKTGVIIFDKQADDVRQLFATDIKFDELLDTSVTAFEIGGRTITLFLWPDRSNPVTIYIQPIPGTANGESMTCSIPVEKLDAGSLKNYLHRYLTDKDFKEEKLQDKDNYVFIPKD
ncbi:hypothetical protein HDF24_03245 [Mucilaginibacter sp. X4EP1]|uniref:hypothetical protein n=1 Tax=Mucilaginibacter sp. X4EP1 TaxID=2723092 RepID=UPI002168709E|nr:hypothetical protein [Mucilaginibacter sp. X4EP1]MCS3812041.1 hypothetical protein [Mucilaginibacter sp. X4EP1]